MDYYRFTIKIPKQPWRWLRFRLATILLLITIAALALAWRKDHLQQLAVRNQLQTEIYQLQNPGPHWDTDEVTGPPNTPKFGDRNTAWASKTQDGQQEWLVLSFAQPVAAKAVQIHENHRPGAVSRITLYPLDGTETQLWQGTDPTPQSAPGGVSTIAISPKQPIQRIKIYLDSHLVPGWNEIDAVGLVDALGKIYWTEKAWASSCYGRNNELPGWQDESFFGYSHF